MTNALLTQTVDNQTTNLNYDLDGNLKNDSKFHYAFDAFQRIVEVKDQSQNLVAKYQMDTSNRRISKTIGTTVHRTVYAGWQVAEEHETAPSGKKFKTTTKVYVYGQYIDEPLVMQITKPSGNQKKYWYLRNQQYSIYALTNDNGKIVETYHYSAYGEVNIEDPNGSTLTESAYANTYFYTGRLLDSETNLYYFRNRYYNANQGRFISRDPLGYVDGMSLYRGYFVIDGSDPLGLSWKQVGNSEIWEATEDGDSLEDLSILITGSSNYASCIWPVGNSKDKDWKNIALYPRASKCDRADVSNLTATSGGTLYISMDTMGPGGAIYQEDRPSAILAPTGTAVYSVLKSTSQEGANPISYFEISGHSYNWPGMSAGRITNNKKVASGNKRIDFLPGLYDPNEPQGTYFRAKAKQGPHKCWFTRNATSYSLACGGSSFGQAFASSFLRVGAWMKTSEENVSISLYDAWFHANDYGFVSNDPSTVTPTVTYSNLTAFLASSYWVQHDGKN